MSKDFLVKFAEASEIPNPIYNVIEMGKITFLPMQELTEEVKGHKRICIICREEVKEIVFAGINHDNGETITFHKILCLNCNSSAFVYQKKE